MGAPKSCLRKAAVFLVNVGEVLLDLIPCQVRWNGPGVPGPVTARLFGGGEGRVRRYM